MARLHSPANRDNYNTEALYQPSSANGPLLLCGLGPNHPGKQSILSHQFRRAATFLNPAAIQHNHLIGSGNRPHSVGNNYYSLILNKS